MFRNSPVSENIDTRTMVFRSVRYTCRTMISIVRVKPYIALYRNGVKKKFFAEE